MTRITKLCRYSALGELETRGFEIMCGQRRERIFVVRKQKRVYAYRNSCPHTGAPLEWMPDRFMDYDGMFIQCALHGALFTVDNGFCVRGPCAGESLQPVDVTIVADDVVLTGEYSECERADDFSGG